MFLNNVSDEDLANGLNDFGGHDFLEILKCLNQSKTSDRPTIIIAHTVKGWGLKSKAECSNHNTLPSKEEVSHLKNIEDVQDTFETFKPGTEAHKFLQKRHTKLLDDFKQVSKIKQNNKINITDIPDSLDINLKFAIFPHTQWMLGQLIAKLTRIANTEVKQKNEKMFKPIAKLLAIMSPDVGTSTNLNPTMDGKIYGTKVHDLESDLNVRDPKSPHLAPDKDNTNRFFRFDITEANTMSCVGSFGKIKELLGAPIIPIMSIYDFFIKRAHDQYFYNLYWDSNFILIGSPSGISLSPEGAQHGWKSDFQIPNQIYMGTLFLPGNGLDFRRHFKKTFWK